MATIGELILLKSTAPAGSTIGQHLASTSPLVTIQPAYIGPLRLVSKTLKVQPVPMLRIKK